MSTTKCFSPASTRKISYKIVRKKNIVDITRIMSDRYLQTEFEKTAKKLNLVWKKLKKIKFSLKKGPVWGINSPQAVQLLTKFYFKIVGDLVFPVFSSTCTCTCTSTCRILPKYPDSSRTLTCTQYLASTCTYR